MVLFIRAIMRLDANWSSAHQHAPDRFLYHLDVLVLRTPSAV